MTGYALWSMERPARPNWVVPVGPTGTTPTLVQGKFTSTNTHADESTAPTTIGLPNNTLSGNCCILCVQQDPTSSANSVSDNLSSGIWSLAVSLNGASVRQEIWVGLNCPSGINEIKVTHNGGSGIDTQYAFYEFYNIAHASALDGTSTGGAFTPGSNGDLVFVYGAQTSGSAVSTWTPASGFTLLHGMNYNSGTDQACFAQYEVQTTATSVTPSISGSSGTLQYLGIALKAASAGTAPAGGIRIVSVQGYNFYGGASGLSGPFTLQFPTTGNLIHMSWVALTTTASPSGLASMSDTAGNTWTTNGSPQTCSLDSSAGCTQHAHAQGAGASATNKITFNCDQIATLSTTHVELYDIIGAQSPSYDTASSTFGKQTSSGNLATASVTPSGSNELVINSTGIDSHDLSGVTGSYLSDISIAPNFDGGGSGLSSDDGYAHAYNVSSSSTCTYTTQNNSAGVQGWVSYSSAYQ